MRSGRKRNEGRLLAGFESEEQFGRWEHRRKALLEDITGAKVQR